MEFRTFGPVRLRLADPPKRRAHYCSDWCHDEDRVDLQRRRQWAELVIVPPHERLVLPLGLKHWCGRHCTPRDPETPVRLGRGRPDPYDRTPVPLRLRRLDASRTAPLLPGCGVMPAARHWCGFAWESIGDGRYHECLVVGRHETHQCADDGCGQSSPVSARGGRKRQDHGHAGRR